MDQFSNIMTTHMSDLFDDNSITKINNLTPVRPIVQEDDIFGEHQEELKATEKNLDIENIKISLNSLKKQIDDILSLFEENIISKKITLSSPISVSKPLVFDTMFIDTNTESPDNFLEGVFNGEKMIGSDSKEYVVPPNYASKSKLVEGDIMKLTFAPNGRFIYKQIGPISRKRIIGILSFDEERQLWNVLHENKKYKVLTASVTFYKGKPNDEAVVLIPQENDCDWCAMENVISK
ncbi:MAG: hypothetical protein PHQ18_00595 [Patescibacteria group bacterium]|nr:hypothetical protein [Patescibacteria group bacterium]